MSITRFPLGQIVATPGALDALDAAGNNPCLLYTSDAADE